MFSLLFTITDRILLDRKNDIPCRKSLQKSKITLNRLILKKGSFVMKENKEK